MTDVMGAAAPVDGGSRPVRHARDLVRRLGGIRIPDFLLGMLFLLGRYDTGLPMPLEIAFMAVAIAVSAFVRPTLRVRGLGFHILFWAAVLAWVIGVSVKQGQPWMQRSFRWGLLVMFCLCLAEGRILWRSFLAGYTFSLVVINIPANFTPLRSDKYEGFLTGLIGDKNVAGLTYAVVGVLFLALVRGIWTRIAVCVLFAVAVYATGSRTSMMAFVAGCLWVVVRNHMGRILRLVCAALGCWAIRYIGRKYSEIGDFSDRAGTDWFRSMIDTATHAKIAASPWFGSGLNTAWVNVYAGRRIWFHDSYAALRIEGGVPLLVAVVGLFLLVLWGLPDRRRRVADEVRICEGAVIAVLVCAWKLGEVFFSTPSFIVIGTTMAARYGVPVGLPAEPTGMRSRS